VQVFKQMHMCVDPRGFALAQEDAGEGELQRGHHHLLGEGLEPELDVCLRGHGAGILLHVDAACGQSLPAPRRRLLIKKTMGNASSQMTERDSVTYNIVPAARNHNMYTFFSLNVSYQWSLLESTLACILALIVV